jgi:hypothetical protein
VFTYTYQPSPLYLPSSQCTCPSPGPSWPSLGPPLALPWPSPGPPPTLTHASCTVLPVGAQIVPCGSAATQLRGHRSPPRSSPQVQCPIQTIRIRPGLIPGPVSHRDCQTLPVQCDCQTPVCACAVCLCSVLCACAVCACDCVAVCLNDCAAQCGSVTM